MHFTDLQYHCRFSSQYDPSLESFIVKCNATLNAYSAILDLFEKKAPIQLLPTYLKNEKQKVNTLPAATESTHSQTITPTATSPPAPASATPVPAPTIPLRTPNQLSAPFASKAFTHNCPPLSVQFSVRPTRYPLSKICVTPTHYTLSTTRIFFPNFTCINLKEITRNHSSKLQSQHYNHNYFLKVCSDRFSPDFRFVVEQTLR